MFITYPSEGTCLPIRNILKMSTQAPPALRIHKKTIKLFIIFSVLINIGKIIERINNGIMDISKNRCLDIFSLVYTKQNIPLKPQKTFLECKKSGTKAA